MAPRKTPLTSISVPAETREHLTRVVLRVSADLGRRVSVSQVAPVLAQVLAEHVDSVAGVLRVGVPATSRATLTSVSVAPPARDALNVAALRVGVAAGRRVSVAQMCAVGVPMVEGEVIARAVEVLAGGDDVEAGAR